MDAKTDTKPNLQDLRTHLDNLQKHDKLTRVSVPINKDTELMPLVRWQFRGLQQDQRKGFLFENVTNAKGQKLSGSVAVSIYAGSPEIYAIGMGCEVGDIRKHWQAAQAAPLKPKVVDYGTVQDEVHMGDKLLEHGGMEEFPIPNSTPGFDVGPYTTASNWVTKDLELNWMNVGNYRGQVKGPTKMGVFIGPRKHAWKHWDQVRQRGDKYLEAALVIGGPPVLTYLSGSRTPYGVEEYAVAGALIGEPLELVKCKTVDLHVPAHAELVIEGRISTEYLEPEAPFGEFTGYMGERVYNAVFETTAITHRKDPIFTAILSQMPPSESSMLKKMGQDNSYLYFLKNHCGLPDVVDISFHEIALESWAVVKLKRCNPSMVWQTLYAIAGRNASSGKYIIAVDEDIDIDDMEFGDLGVELSLAAGPRHENPRQPRYRAGSVRPAAADRIARYDQAGEFRLDDADRCHAQMELSAGVATGQAIYGACPGNLGAAPVAQAHPARAVARLRIGRLVRPRP